MSLPTRWSLVRSGIWALLPILTTRGRYEGRVQRHHGPPETSPWDWSLTADGGRTTFAKGTEPKLNTAMRAALTALDSHEWQRENGGAT